MVVKVLLNMKVDVNAVNVSVGLAVGVIEGGIVKKTGFARRRISRFITRQDFAYILRGHRDLISQYGGASARMFCVLTTVMKDVQLKMASLSS